MRLVAACGGLAVLALAALGASSAATEVAGRPSFAYDRTRPLDLQLGVAQQSAGGLRQQLTFDAGNGRTTAFWTQPEGEGPWPVVLFSPGSNGTAATQLGDADRLARRGIASLTVTPPAPLVSCRAAADVRAYVRYVVGRRRALDLLPLLPGADAKRVAAVGFSFGAAVTATLAGVDHRLRGAVVQSGRAHLSAPIGAFCGRRLGPAGAKAYVRAYASIDPLAYVGRAAPVALLFQNGRRDPISPPQDVRLLVGAAKQPKELRWYAAGHELNQQALSERDAWLAKLLGA